jgi:phosphatidylserine/phosphatidylglycerophosphate/cardiolipin synthase-like enzyme
MVQQPSHASAHTRRRSRRQVGIYLDGTQLAEREPAKVFNDLAETPGVEIGIKHKTRDPMHLKSYKIDGKLLHTGAVNFSASGLKRQDNDLIVIESVEAAVAFRRNFNAQYVSGGGSGGWREGDNDPLADIEHEVLVKLGELGT